MAKRSYGDAARLTRQAAHEVTGQRKERTTDVYQPKEGFKEVSFCTKCGIIYRSNRWYVDEAELEQVKSDPEAVKIVCPSCLRMQDSNPGGVITLSGEYMRKHEVEILDLIRNKEASYRAKNPLARIMEISQEGNVLTISTTEEKLAEKLGREVYKAHKGDLHYQWGENEKFVRVSWAR